MSNSSAFDRFGLNFRRSIRLKPVVKQPARKARQRSAKPNLQFERLESRQMLTGDFVWVNTVGGTGNEIANAVATDSAGNVYTAGYFQGTVDFDPGSGTTPLTSAGGTDIFVTKVDNSGALLWARSMGGGGTDAANGIAVDSTGNVYTTGSFNGTADFDPSGSVSNLVSAGSSDIFVSRLDSSGNHVWARRMGGIDDDVANGIVVDSTGNVYATGTFSGTADFDPGLGVSNLISAGSSDIFVSKLNSSGNYVWARSLGGSTVDDAAGIAVDATGNVYTTGYFTTTADFDPGLGISNLISAGSSDVFVSRLDSNGNYVWARGMGGSGDINGISGNDQG
ncbi:MAG: SBBP repeat-containing protein, partial [Pirellulaceae bacterium]